MTARQFTSSPAVRSRVPLLLGVAGMAGSGKTFSALRLARGIVSVVGGNVAGLDTETNRMLHYAHTAKCGKDCRNPGHFDFKHMPFSPPYDAMSYVDGVRQAIAEGAGCTVIDSASDMHEGIGGMLDQQETFLDERCGNDFDKRKRMNAASWKHVKDPLKRAILSLMQLNTVVICCFRAREKNDWGDKVKSLGTMAIADDNLIFSMTAQALLAPGAEGVPTWDPPLAGEKVQTKRGPFKDLIAGLKGPMSEEMGTIMGRWCLGDSAAPVAAPMPRQERPGAPATTVGKTRLATLLESIQQAATPTELEQVMATGAGFDWSESERGELRAASRKRKGEL